MIGDRHSKTVFIGFLALISLCYARSLDSDLAEDNEVVVLEKREEDEVILDLELENRDNEDMTELEERLENIIALEEKGAAEEIELEARGGGGFFFQPNKRKLTKGGRSRARARRAAESGDLNTSLKNKDSEDVVLDIRGGAFFFQPNKRKLKGRKSRATR
ncbi:uncharacterized protein LOC134826155 [Bolinopsis microptera]|uniref:uncharacterized protein LOC134826155 n=1 Tax=Bolinopsis microptera TaxID=2820187 RepID=UPI00307AD0D5